MKTQNANPPAGSIYERFARAGRTVVDHGSHG
jgi:hypothetical protein